MSRISTRTLLMIGSVLVVVALILSLAQSESEREGVLSPEVHFADGSVHGLSIVPASCPSSPHYAGECTTQDKVPLQCSMGASSWIVTKGDSTTLSWIGPQGRGALGVPVSYVSGSITGIGPVAQSGSQTVTPQVTTTYVFQGTEAWGGTFRSSFSCDATIVVTNTPIISCPAGQSFDADGNCVAAACPAPSFYCGTGVAADNLYQRTYSAAPACGRSDALFATCRYGCTSNACNDAPANPEATLTAKPALVRQGNTVQVAWSSVEVKSCTITGTNGDKWTTKIDTVVSSPITEQTTFTLSCVGRNGTTITRSAVVNIVPVFQEQ